MFTHEFESKPGQQMKAAARRATEPLITIISKERSGFQSFPSLENIMSKHDDYVFCASLSIIVLHLALSLYALLMESILSYIQN